MKRQTIATATLLVTVTALLGLAPDAGATMPPGWSDPVQLDYTSTPFYDTQGPTVAVASDGTALAAWAGWQSDLAAYAVMYATYTPAEGWGRVRVIADACFNANLDAPSVAVSPSGTFLLAWANHDTGYVCQGPTVWAMFWNASGVMVPMVAGIASANVYDPQAGIDDLGNGIVLFRASDGVQTNLTAWRYTPAGGWNPSEVLDSQMAAVMASSLAVDPAGNAVAVWRQDDGVAPRAFARRYTAGVGWGATETIDNGPLAVIQVAVALDAGGNGFAAIRQTDGAHYRVYVNTFAAAAGWGTPAAISPADSLETYGVSVAGSAGGDFAVAWTQGPGPDFDVRAATFTAAAGWTAAVRVTAGGTGDAYANAVSVTPEGAVYVSLYEMTPSGASNVFVAIAIPGGAWGEPFRIDSTDNSRPMDIGCGGAGECILLMRLSDGLQNNLFATVFTPPDKTLPSLGLDAPLDGEATASPTVIVRGFAEQGAAVTVNGVKADVSGAGAYNVALGLLSGNNAVTITATDAAGNRAAITVHVTYTDPVPGLESELAAAQADLTATQGQLAAAQTELTATHAALNTTQATLAASQSSSAAKDAELQAKVDSAAGSVGTAMLLGLLGLLAGAAAIAMAFMMGKKRSGPMAPPMPNVEAPAQAPAPPAQPPAEPPKTG